MQTFVTFIMSKNTSTLLAKPRPMDYTDRHCFMRENQYDDVDIDDKNNEKTDDEDVNGND